MHTIIRMPKYLLVTLEGEAEYQDFKNAIEEELTREDYPIMNDIWQLDNCLLSIKYNQFDRFTKDIQLRYPQQATRTKTAIVASSGISRAIVQLWAEQAIILPYETQIFMSLQEAEKWTAELVN